MPPKPNRRNMTSEADEESMMAETLLKIRSDSVTARDAASSSAKIPRAIPTLLSPPRPLKTTTMRSGLSSPASVAFSPALSVSSIGSPCGSLSPDFLLQNQQVFGSVSNQALNIQQALQQTTGVAPLAAASNAMSFLQLLSGTTRADAGKSILPPPAASVAAPLPLRTPSMLVRQASDASEPPDDRVRKDEVEKALHSKPQRGRKRDNLNDVERLELTRTRNREHAKSTRIRKKARHQELIESEKKLKELLRTEELNKKRRDCVLDFLSVRDGYDSNKRDGTSPASNFEMPQKNLDDVMEDTSTFTFELDSSTDDAETMAVARMRQFDETLASRVALKLNKEEPSPLLSYKLKGTSDDIALSANGSAIVEVQIHLNRPVNGQVLSALLRLDFAPNSDKLRSGRFITISDAIENGLDQLDGQVSHPSVISLDADRGRREVGNNKDKSFEGDDNSGPGMNI